MHADFLDTEALADSAAVHLRVDQRSGGLELDAVENLLGDQLEGTVQVAHAHAEQHLYQKSAEELGIEAADEWIPPLDAIAGDDVVVVRHQRQDDVEVLDVELPVAVHVEDEALDGGIEAGAQGGAVAAILRMMQRPQAGYRGLQPVEDLARTVLAAVVDDQKLVVEPEAVEIG